MGVATSLLMLLCGSIGMVSDMRSAVAAFEYSYAHSNIIILMFVADTFAYSACFAEEWHSGYFRLSIIRSSPTAYALSKCVSTVISGGVSVTLGAVIFMIGLCFKQPQVMPYYYETTLCLYNFLENVDHPFFFFGQYLMLIFLQAMFFSVLGLLATGYFTNKYVAYATPVTLAYAINRLTSEVLRWPVWTDPMRIVKARLFYLPVALQVLIPIVVFTGLTAICTALFVRAVKRRIANG